MEYSDIRIPLNFLKELVATENKTKWTFTTDGGNVLTAKKIEGIEEKTGRQWISIDFLYNPED
jgi:hypothetical protein